jgi:hypothetical protein
LHQWVAEQRLRGCTPDAMLATLVASGVDPGECAAAIEAMDADPVFLAARRHQQLLHKLQSVAGNLQKLWESHPGYTRIEKRPVMPRSEFIESYVAGNRPVVITGLARDWPAMDRWCPQDLKQRFGQEVVEIQGNRNADPHYERNKLAHRQHSRLGDFVDRVLAGGPTNDYYMTANNELLRSPPFRPLLDDIGSLPDFCDRSQLGRMSSFWFGPAGTVTPLHHDTLMLLHTQVVGRKRWRFISPLETPNLYNYDGVFSPIDVDHPDLSRYPDFAKVKMLDVVVEPGETVFLPLGWWHQVTSLDVSLSFSFSNLDVPNHFTYETPALRHWLPN